MNYLNSSIFSSLLTLSLGLNPLNSLPNSAIDWSAPDSNCILITEDKNTSLPCSIKSSSNSYYQDTYQQIDIKIGDETFEILRDNNNAYFLSVYGYNMKEKITMVKTSGEKICFVNIKNKFAICYE